MAYHSAHATKAGQCPWNTLQTAVLLLVRRNDRPGAYAQRCVNIQQAQQDHLEKSAEDSEGHTELRRCIDTWVPCLGREQAK